MTLTAMDDLENQVCVIWRTRCVCVYVIRGNAGW